MKAEYGDYLAYTCPSLRNESMGDLVWKIDKCDWQKVARQIEKEEKTKAQQEARGLAISPTPYLDDIIKAPGSAAIHKISIHLRRCTAIRSGCHRNIENILDII